MASELIVLVVPADRREPCYLDYMTSVLQINIALGGAGTPHPLEPTLIDGDPAVMLLGPATEPLNVRASFLAARFGATVEVEKVTGPALFLGLSKPDSLESVPAEIVNLSDSTFEQVQATPTARAYTHAHLGAAIREHLRADTTDDA